MAPSVSDEGESRDERYLAAACEPISFCPWHNTLGRQGDEDQWLSAWSLWAHARFAMGANAGSHSPWSARPRSKLGKQ